MFQFLPMAIGGGLGLLTSKDPLQGAVTGAALGGLTGGLGGLGGAAQAAGTGLQAGGAAVSGAAGSGLTAGAQAAGSSGLYSLAPGAAPATGILAGNAGQGIAATVGNGVQLTPSTAKIGGLAGLLNKDNLEAAGNVAGMAGKLGIFDDPQQAPAAQSAGIPARQADFSGLLRSQGQANNAAGAQRLLQQQMARKQGRL